MLELKCKICDTQLSLSNKSSMVAWCRNNSFDCDGHYYAIIDDWKNILVEAWMPDFPNRGRIIRQDYDINSTFISSKFISPNFGSDFNLDYLLFDFNNFNEQKWFEKIELCKFYT